MGCVPFAGELWPRAVDSWNVAARWSWDSGWTLTVVHRHDGGEWNHCWPDVYRALTSDEAAQVLCATAETLGRPTAG